MPRLVEVELPEITRQMGVTNTRAFRFGPCSVFAGIEELGGERRYHMSIAHPRRDRGALDRRSQRRAVEDAPMIMGAQHRITFRDVGRSKRTWTVELPDLDYTTLYKAVRDAGALASRGIDFVFNDTGRAGMILVGGFRKIGTFTIE